MDSIPSSNPRRRSSTVAQSHRRPFWAKNERAYRIYIETPPQRSFSQSPIYDQGMDNFSYDPDHLERFAMPSGLPDKLPQELLSKVMNWQKAGAALCTALDRIDHTYKAAVNYAFPDKCGKPPSRRTFGEQAVEGADSPLLSLPVSPSVALPAVPVLELERLALIQSLEHTSTNHEIGMESPPFTPTDSFGCDTPSNATAKPMTVLPSLANLYTELTPLSTPEALTPAGNPEFDEKSWEFYLRRWKHEREDNQHAFSRFKGYGREIAVLCLELHRETKPELKLAMIDFAHWWEKTKAVVRQCKQRLDDIEIPDLLAVGLESEAAEANSTSSDPNQNTYRTQSSTSHSLSESATIQKDALEFA